MIRNLIFDMGNVLIRFQPDLFLERLSLSPEDALLLKETIFGTHEWACLDMGTLTERDMVPLIRRKLPERLHEAAEELILRWHEPLILIPGMEELIAEWKKKGLGIYLLSNASPLQHEYWPRITASPLFDGTLISGDVHMVKPDPGIYMELFRTFSLKPEECFFIDDSKPNILAGRALGMDGHVFDGDVLKLSRILEDRMSNSDQG